MVTPDLVSKVLLTIKTAADAQYFFDNLHSADWVSPLYEAGLFGDPPGPNEHENSITYPVWPASRYLARVAEQVPDTILEVIKAIPDSGNPRVYEDLVDAAVQLPAEVAVQLVPQALKWCETPHQMLLPNKVADLTESLASGGFHEAALRLLEVLLGILPDPRAEEEYSAEGERISLLRPETRTDEWTFKQIVSDRVPGIIADAGIEGLRFVSDLLDRYVHLSQTDPSYEGPEDYSFIWRPAIENHSQNRSHGLDDVLIEAVRDVSQQLLGAEPNLTQAILQELESRGWDVFQRISLHLLRSNPELFVEEIAQRLSDRQLFDSVGIFHEFWMLAAEQFGTLAPEAKGSLLSHLEAGPPASYLAQLDDPEHSTKIWRWRRLALLGSDLPEPLKTEYDDLQKIFGQQEHPEFLTYSTGVMTGPNSPLSREALAEMDPTDIVQWLLRWEPSGGFMAPSAEGLGRELASVVATKPQSFADSANEFEGLQPTYVRSVFDGLRQACTNDNQFDWAHVLQLCQWAIAQGREAGPNGLDSFETDTNWLPTRRSIANLMAEGFSSKPCQIPQSMRLVAWSVIEPLTEDPEPSRADEIQKGFTLGDPATASINTVRGLAMHAAARYALWVKRHNEESKSGGMEKIPEALKVLEDSLRNDLTATVRSVFGQWFPWLVLIDSEWTKAHEWLIFPTEANLAYLRDAAWDTYIKMSQAYDDVFDILRPQYVEAVNRIQPPPPQGLPYRHSNICLAEHLIIFYWRNKINFGDSDGLLKHFFDKASDELIADAIGFVGRNVENYEGPFPLAMLDRSTVLWQQRIDAIAASGDVDNHQKELAAFGWWFMSSQWDEMWVLDNLLKVLQLNNSVEADNHVVHRLAELSLKHRSKTILALRHMIEGDEQGWRISLWNEDARTVLDNAIHSGEAVATEQAVDLIHYLAARNHSQFGDLLP